MKYLSVCSGIEAATTAWHPLGWQPIAFSEIEKFPSAVLAHHWPDVPNLGDMTQHHEWNIPAIDLLVGGTPCQSFSVAGLRRGLKDPRGNLTLTFLAMVDRLQPTWVVWENVPGVLSDRTNAFGQFLAGLAELGYEYAYRVLDAQHFGVPQRRRRVFVVACAQTFGVHPAKVLFEPESLCRDLTPRRETRERVAGTFGGRTSAGGGLGTDFECDGGLVPEVAPTLSAESYSPSKSSSGQQLDWCIPEIANTLTARMHKGINTTLDEGQTPVPVAFETRFARNGRGAPDTVVPPLKAQSGGTGKGDAAPCVATPMAVRRLTPTECERLQGFPDGHTLIPWRGKEADQCPDGPRYKALGNSMAVPVMHWIGKQIQKHR